MNKFILALPLFFASVSAYSQPYVVAGYGVNSMSHNERVVFRGTSPLSLKPDSSDSTWSLGFGYRLENNFGFEIRYNQFEVDTSREILTAFPSVGNNFATVTNNWKAEIKAKRLEIKPVYFFDINEKFSVKAGAGLAYTKYDISGYSYQETDYELADFDTYRPIAGVINPGSRTKNEVGIVASLGLNLNVWQGITLGAEAGVGYDKMARTAQILGTIGYTF